MGRAKNLFLDYSWILLVLGVIFGGLWLAGAFDSDQSRVAAAPDDPYVEFYPGEVVGLDPEYNASCLNQHLPFSVVARWKYDTHVERVNVTHKVRKWDADLVLKRVDRHRVPSPHRCVFTNGLLSRVPVSPTPPCRGRSISARSCPTATPIQTVRSTPTIGTIRRLRRCPDSE